MVHAQLIGVFVLLACVRISCQSESERIILEPTDYEEEIIMEQDPFGYDAYGYMMRVVEVINRVPNQKETFLIDTERRLNPPRKKKCPPGFQYEKLADKCYMVVYERHSWASAVQRCRDLQPKAHLVSITNEDEDIGVGAYLAYEFEVRPLNACEIPAGENTGSLVWTSGKRPDETSCTEPFVWKISNDTQLPLSYSNWNEGEPNRSKNEECCIGLNRPGPCYICFKLTWKDLKCDAMICPVCEHDPL